MTKKVTKKLPQTKKVASKPKKTSAKTSKLSSQTKQLKPKKLSAEEKYWDRVNQLAQAKIYHLFTTNLPFQNIPLIKETWKFEETQLKKVGLFLRRDVDYRTLLIDLESEWYERVEEYGEELPEKETMAEEVALWYCRLVMKALIRDLSDYSGYDLSFFENLNSDEY